MCSHTSRLPHDPQSCEVVRIKCNIVPDDVCRFVYFLPAPRTSEDTAGSNDTATWILSRSVDHILKIQQYVYVFMELLTAVLLSVLSIYQGKVMTKDSDPEFFL